MYSKETFLFVLKHIVGIEFQSVQYLITKEEECSSVPMFIFEGMSKVSRHLIGDMFIPFFCCVKLNSDSSFIQLLQKKEFSLFLLDSLSFFSLSRSLPSFIYIYIQT